MNSTPAKPVPPSHWLGELPQGGLFADSEWIWPSRPFRIPPKIHARLARLGHQLARFQAAVDLLYHQSLAGRQPPWIAQYFDLGKPAALLDVARSRSSCGALPVIIRPDLILLDENRFAVSELDSVPGGIGLTAWMSRVFSDAGHDVLGGRDGMLDGFRSIFPGGEILVSEEASTYRPEMEWLAQMLNQIEGTSNQWRVTGTDDRSEFSPRIYRFFELFDRANIGCFERLAQQVVAGNLSVTPPLKPWMEEKLAFALFWTPALSGFWQRQLGRRYWSDLREILPFTWILDPEPIPHQAVYPRLEVQTWDALKAFSQRERELVIKASGFSDLAWGARSVSVGHDLSHQEWGQAIDDALLRFSSGPYILQVFQHGGLFPQSHLGADHKERLFEGRVRLCPYYFLAGSRVRCGGTLATVCPADKKILHGMKDAVLTPCAASS